ncbi:YgdB family protein [Edaphovirga cremea]|uniref:YgdB family protein n=1 Tax=Edaphovirga cremea TaxID=2267246 RepID=UPI000DEEBCD1|nr:YgdB family protein [Edaphovirga cremea]
MKQGRGVAQRQRGSITLLSIVMLMALGLMMLNALHQQLTNALQLVAEERHYLRAWNQAASALSWGSRQSWQLSDTAQWQCQKPDNQSFVSCLRQSPREGIYLLKGMAATVKQGEALALYTHLEPRTTENNSQVMSVVKRSWLDFCPVTDSQFCR